MEAVLRERLLGLLEGFRGLRVMVVGDLVLDHYLVGDAGRISREYPVIILNHERDEYRPGGAANTIANLTALGAEVVPAGWIGADGPGETAESELVRNVEQRADEVDGFVLSDYGHGALTPRVAETVIRLSEDRYVGLDSRHRVLSYPGVTAATPNLEETAEATGLGLGNEAMIEKAGALLHAKLGAEALLITRGEEGMSLFELEARPVHIPVANRSEVFDVTGAGDTVVAAFTLARLAGSSYLEAAHLANVAGGLSVRHAGATPVEVGELRDALRATE